MGGTLGVGTGCTEGATIGQTRGGQIGVMSSELVQIAVTSPFMHTHWQSAWTVKEAPKITINQYFFIIMSLYTVQH